MSIFKKKNALAVALVAGLAIASTAGAYTVLTGGDTAPEKVANEAGAAFTMTENVSVKIDLGDAVIGRTTGFQVKIVLADTAAGTLVETGTAGPQFGASSGPFTLGNAAQPVGGWRSNLAAGGTAGTRIVQYTVEPQAAGSFITEGTLGVLNALRFQNAGTGSVWANVQIIDPVTGTGLHSQIRELVTRVPGVAFTCTKQTSPDQIDVGTNVQFPNAKTAFVGDDNSFAIGGADSRTAPLGTISVATTGFSLNVATGGDTLTSRVTGNFTSFTDVFLATSATCATNIGSYTINAAKTQANLNRSFAALNTAGGSFNGSGGSATLCVTVNGTTQVAAQMFTVENGINGTFTPPPSPSQTCEVAELKFNGSVVDVYHINPAGNNTAQSFVRVINPSNVSGTVTLEGIDDAGVKAAAPVRFVLGARQSMQVNSNDLELGNAAKGLTGAWGNGTGKWRAVVTGEFGGMRVQGLNRNATDGTVTNLTDADGRGEQAFNKLFD